MYCLNRYCRRWLPDMAVDLEKDGGEGNEQADAPAPTVRRPVMRLRSTDRSVNASTWRALVARRARRHRGRQRRPTPRVRQCPRTARQHRRTRTRLAASQVASGAGDGPPPPRSGQEIGEQDSRLSRNVQPTPPPTASACRRSAVSDARGSTIRKTNDAAGAPLVWCNRETATVRAQQAHAGHVHYLQLIASRGQKSEVAHASATRATGAA